CLRNVERGIPCCSSQSFCQSPLVSCDFAFNTWSICICAFGINFSELTLLGKITGAVLSGELRLLSSIMMERDSTVKSSGSFAPLIFTQCKFNMLSFLVTSQTVSTDALNAPLPLILPCALTW